MHFLVSESSEVHSQHIDRYWCTVTEESSLDGTDLLPNRARPL